MQKILLAIFSLIIITPTFALADVVCNTFSDSRGKVAAFPKSFKSESELKHFAETSTWGGGYMERIPFKSMTLIVVRRSYTSGVETSDLGIYSARMTEHAGLIGHCSHIYHSHIDYKIDGDVITFKTKDYLGKDSKVIVELTAADLLGKACNADADCNADSFCFKNNYFKPKGICYPKKFHSKK